MIIVEFACKSWHLVRVLGRTLFSGTEHDFSDADAVQIFGDKLLLKSK